MQWQQVNLTK